MKQFRWFEKEAEHMSRWQFRKFWKHRAKQVKSLETLPAEDVQRADAATQADVGIDIKMPNFLPFYHPSDREAEVQTDHQQANVVTEARNVICFSVGDTAAGLENTVANGSRTDSSSTVTATTDSRTQTHLLQVDRQGVQYYMRPLMAELCTHPEVLHDLCQDDPNSAFGGHYRSDTECTSDVDFGSNQSMASERREAARRLFVPGPADEGFSLPR